jgi:thiol-disulfide isomerase/thioredoxin
VNKLLQTGIFLAAAGLAGVAGFYFSRESAKAPETESVRMLMLSTLSDPGGKQQAMSQWRGKVLVINFWATWCAPCREEIPALMRIHRKFASNSVQLVGIAIDNVTKVRSYAEEMRIDYDLLIGDMNSLTLSRDLGNRAGVLPFTVVLDRGGKVAYAHAGALTEATLEAILTPLI